MNRAEMECPGCGHWVYLSPMDGWRNDAHGYTCVPSNTTHSMHIVPALIIDRYRADLRAEVQVMRDEATESLRFAEGYVEISAAGIGIAVLDDVLKLIDGDGDG